MPLFIYFVLLIGFNSCSESTKNVEEEKPNSTYRYLALGDSYTIGTAIGVEHSYATLLKDSLMVAESIYVDLDIIAKNGWTTANLQNGIANESPENNYDLVTLLIGVNNQYQKRSLSEYKTQFIQLLQQSVQFAGGDKTNVFVISIPDWGVTPAGASNRNTIASEIDEFNEINKAVSDSLNVNYLEITQLSRTALNNPNLVASDGLHFSAKMHQLWLNSIYNPIQKSLISK